MKQMMIEITIPVLNEETTLEENINKLINYIKDKPFGICIADNGSTDRTSEIATQLSKKNTNIRFLRVSKRGVGLALKESWKSSTADVIGYMDLDLATDINHLEDIYQIFYKRKKNVDIVYGSRLNKKSIVKNRTLLRTFTSRVFNWIIKFYFSSKIEDGMCGFKFLKREHINFIIKNGAIIDGWFFCTELLIVAEKNNLKLLPLPVKWEDDNNSKVKVIQLSLEYLSDMKLLKNRLK